MFSGEFCYEIQSCTHFVSTHISMCTCLICRFPRLRSPRLVSSCLLTNLKKPCVTAKLSMYILTSDYFSLGIQLMTKCAAESLATEERISPDHCFLGPPLRGAGAWQQLISAGTNTLSQPISKVCLSFFLLHQPVFGIPLQPIPHHEVLVMRWEKGISAARLGYTGVWSTCCVTYSASGPECVQWWICHFHYVMDCCYVHPVLWLDGSDNISSKEEALVTFSVL